MTQPKAKSSWKVRRGALAGILVYAAGLVLVLSFLATNTAFIARLAESIGWGSEERNPLMHASIRATVQRGAQIPGNAVAILGDSIMAGLNAAPLEFGVYNLGLNGLTATLLMEFVQELPALAGARAMILGIGVNDLRSRKLQQVVPDYTVLVEKLPAAPMLVIVAVLPVKEDHPQVQAQPFLRNVAIAAFNVAIRDICARRSRCLMVETAPLLADAAGNLREEFHAGDGWHLSADGTNRLAEAIRSVIHSSGLQDGWSP